MSDTWVTIIALTAFTVSIKGAGPLLLGGRDLPAPVMKVIDLLAPAILSALIVVGTFTAADGDLELDARAAGLAAAAAVYSFSRSALLGAGVAAAVVAAALRAIG